MTRSRLLFAILFASLVSVSSWAGDNVFSANAVTFAPGQSAPINVELTNTDEVNGVQFNLQLPEGFSFVKDEEGKPTFTLGERISDFRVICKEMEKGRFRIMAFSFHATPVAGNQGVILSMTVTCDSTMPTGDYTVRFQDVHLSLTGKDNAKPSYDPADFETVITVK